MNIMKGVHTHTAYRDTNVNASIIKAINNIILHRKPRNERKISQHYKSMEIQKKN
nr:MAG TPA: hypothetical protein [Caudoviricetes sp.]